MSSLRAGLRLLVDDVASRRGRGSDDWASAYIAGQLNIASRVADLIAEHDDQDCPCGHGHHLHETEADPELCMVCGSGERCKSRPSDDPVGHKRKAWVAPRDGGYHPTGGGPSGPPPRTPGAAHNPKSS